MSSCGAPSACGTGATSDAGKGASEGGGGGARVPPVAVLVVVAAVVDEVPGSVLETVVTVVAGRAVVGVAVVLELLGGLGAEVVDVLAAVVDVVVLVGAAPDGSARSAAGPPTPRTTSTSAATSARTTCGARRALGRFDPGRRHGSGRRGEAIPAGCRLAGSRTRTPPPRRAARRRGFGVGPRGVLACGP